MIKNILCIFCKDIIEDSQTKLISYINRIDEISVKKFPVKLPELCLGTIWKKDTEKKETLKIKIKFILPDGKEKVLIETPSIEMMQVNHRVNCTVAGVPLEAEGCYKFVVEILNKDDWEYANEAEFRVIKR